MNLIRSLATVSLFTLLTKMSGFIRSMLMTSILGASVVSDALIIALKIANVLRKIFAEGAFNSAFIPVFSKVNAVYGTKRSMPLASKTFSFLLFLTTIISFLVIHFYDKVVIIFAPGFSGSRLVETIYLGKILFPFIIPACLVALMSSILNTLGKFAVPASIQILVNLASIGALIASEYCVYEAAYLVSIAIVTAGFLQVVVLWSNLYVNGFIIKIRTNVFSSSLKKILINMGPAIASVGVYEINAIVGNQFASMLGTGVVSYLFYADQIMQLPFSIFGVALGSALLPTFSSNIQRGKLHLVNFNFNKTLIFSLGFAIPSAVSIFFISDVVVSFIYGHGKFGIQDVNSVASILKISIISLPLQVMIKIMSSLFFASDNNKMPLRGALINFCTNFVVIASTIHSHGYIAIAYGTVTASLFNALYLYSSFPPYISVLRITKRLFLKQILTSTVLGLYCYEAGSLFCSFYYYDEYVKIMSIALMVVVGIVIYTYLGAKLGFVNLRKLFKELTK